MKIINLKSKNVKGVKAIDITPKDNVVIISGKNGAGKTSALDSIWFALKWKAGSKGTPMPIRKGEKQADVRLAILEDLSEKEIEKGMVPRELFIVNRKWTSNDKSYLKVTNGKGMSYNSPQELLDGFVGELSFDPLEFTRMNEKDQKELILKIMGVDISKIEEQIEITREERRLQGQVVRTLTGEREEITMKNLPEKEILTSKLNEELEKAINHNQEIQGAKEKIEREEDQITKAGIRIKYLEAEITTLKQTTEDTKSKVDIGEKYLEGNETIDTSLIRKRIEDAQETNLQVMARGRNKSADKKQKEAEKVYVQWTGKIKGLQADIERKLKASKMPIEELNINDTGVTYKDMPLSQVCSTEKLKVGMAIAIALNPKLRVILVTDASLLDKQNMDIIKGMAKDEDFQVWLEKVDDSGKIGFYIEEGEIKNN